MRESNTEVEERKSKSFYASISLLIITFIVEIIAFCVLYKYQCSILCLENKIDSNFYSCVGVVIGAVVSLVVFVLGFFQAIMSLQEETFKGIEMKKIFKVFHFYYLFLLISILITFGLIGLTLTFYLKKMLFCSIKLCIALFFHAIYVVEIEASGMMIDDPFLYWILRLEVKKEIKEYNSKIKKVKKMLETMDNEDKKR